LFPIADAQLFLKAMMLGASDEVYILDASSMKLVYVSENAQKNLGLDPASFKPKNIDGLLGVSKEALRDHIKLSKSQANIIEVTLEQDPVVVNTDDYQLRVMLLQANQKEYILVIKNDLTSNERTLQALNESESRFQAIVSNTPGMVFQFRQDSEGEIAFIYLSGGSKSLLGLDPEELLQNSKNFYSIMNARDHSVLRTRMKASATELCLLDWDGRVWIDGWQDTKWINLRATPRKLSNGVVIWDGIMLNITQSKKEKFEIEQSRRDLADLTAHINSIREDERKKIAREIHDDLGGNLTAIKMGLSSLIDQPKFDPKAIQEHTKGLLSIVDNTFATAHRISGNLRPNILDLGIVDAVEWQTKEFQKQLTIPCKFTCNRAEISVSTEQAMAMFRICQEAMSNIAKYAQATEVSVDLNASDNEVVMMISDNGIGIKPNDKLKTDSFGLRGMQERAIAMHGSFRISKPIASRQGTVITVKLPI
jgi:two-component system, NarL family, sensor histidine kinase UhpB